METYTLLNTLPGFLQCVQRDSDKAVIPFDEGNRDYRDYLAWLEEGNTPEPA